MAQDNLNEGISESVDKTQDFYKSNSKIINIVLLAILIVGGGSFAYVKFIKEPNEAKAALHGWAPLQYSMNDSLDTALDGDQYFKGLLELADEDAGTKAADLHNFEAGVIFMKKGEFETAINHFEDTDFSNDAVLAIFSTGLIGDCYSELGKYKDALGFYRKAVKISNDPMTVAHFGFKAARVAELELGDNGLELALGFYQDYVDRFPETEKSNNQQEALKNIGRIEQLIAK